MKDYAKCTLADMILKYIDQVEDEGEKEDPLKEEDDGEEDIFKEPMGMGKPKIVVKSIKLSGPKKG